MTADLDLIRHDTRFERSDGRRAAVAHGTTVAEYYRGVRAALDELGVTVRIGPVPQEVPAPIPFDQDTRHSIYDPEQANLIWQAFLRARSVYDQYASGYWGKQTPPGYWGGGDFSMTRYSGRQAQAPEGLPKIMTGSLDAESVTHTFTLGSDQAPAPAYMTMGFPPGPGVESARVQPSEAGWMQAPGMPGVFALSYDAVRTAADPRATLLSFLRSTYEAFSEAGRWDRALLEQRPPDLSVKAAA